ncbi:ribonuclease H-like domain-containing protein [Cantharellus anzutake]|uniref:ribonuclease H-like domain-containing protein n=1 Tax=Cantharellus anzutake TaxID=1750568 RepID=UPI001907D01D|nr:ribonuclease H-like domain-containing protein [Cantharellus anzutake]KAF8333976.1 ribonuclease H-like domain-containing protein [Cantharellus anzutake]
MQPYDAFLVVDVEATCHSGCGFDYPNEIIEWPVILLRWNDQTEDGRASSLVQVAEFRSYVRPTWRPQLSTFCTDLTGITQADIDSAPTWPEVLGLFAEFLAHHGLIDPRTGARSQKFIFCCDGPFDIRDFVTKQSHISKIPIPGYLRGDILDIRKSVASLMASRELREPMTSTAAHIQRNNQKHLYLPIPMQLSALLLPSFTGRLHCGLDDARNVARILIELARTPLRVEPNTRILPNRRWWWMGPGGKVNYPDSRTPA